MGYQNDGNISYDAIITRVNTDLANVFGNLVSRTSAMINQYFKGVIPKATLTDELAEKLISDIKDEAAKAKNAMDLYYFSEASSHIIQLLRHCNKYIDDTTPWILGKNLEENGDKLKTVLANLTEGIRAASVLFTPFMPETVNMVAKCFAFDSNSLELPALADFSYPSAGKTVNKIPLLFKRVDKAEFEKAQAEIKKTQINDEVKNEITIDDFAKIDLVVGKVINCERVPKSQKLLKLIVDIGDETRAVASGIAKFYAPEDLINKKVILVKNLKPANLFGIESRGMILASGDDKTGIKVVFVDDSVAPGTGIR